MNMLTQLWYKMMRIYLPSGKTIVPVPLSLNVLVAGLRDPIGYPKVFPFPLWVCALPSGTLTPDILEIPGLDVVFKQKVLDVGADNGLCFDTCFFYFGATYGSAGIKL